MQGPFPWAYEGYVFLLLMSPEDRTYAPCHRGPDYAAGKEAQNSSGLGSSPDSTATDLRVVSLFPYV